MPPSDASPGAPASGLAEQVARDLRERILTGELGSGQPLREAALATAHGASRNTVREAFRLLARDRLVVHEAHKGVTVRTLTADDVRDIYRVRLALEPAGLGSVDPDELGAVVEAAQRAAAAGDWAAVSTADLRFHQLLVTALGSPRFDEMFLSVLAEQRLAFAQVASGRDLHAPYLERNAGMVAMLRRGEVEAAETELRAYLADAREELCAAVEA
ncbi:GntR family transcriptional regulator [Nocardioides sp. CFH 31398]|uniref:GntR family transcriptional regulator n=1 Tax=Nocardioides sp. CFH 31398 TaxID=2919579 RepID=UPI001F05E44D|nr:GntR family transcriptional regulator [Nocardioides sp. CFH 31398]MCH1866643.1 GntR family transcriptional regulator [Nocardioides sp. CFH 31398]